MICKLFIHYVSVFRDYLAREVLKVKVEPLEQRYTVPFTHVNCPAKTFHWFLTVSVGFSIIQGSLGEKGMLGLPGIRGDVVRFHYLFHSVAIINMVKHIQYHVSA